MKQEKNYPSEIYNLRLSKEKISYDENQNYLLKNLDKYFVNLKNNKNNSKNIFKNFFEKSKFIEYQGLYIYGPVGTGKSMIMDIFYESVNSNPIYVLNAPLRSNISFGYHVKISQGPF